MAVWAGTSPVSGGCAPRRGPLSNLLLVERKFHYLKVGRKAKFISFFLIFQDLKEIKYMPSTNSSKSKASAGSEAVAAGRPIVIKGARVHNLKNIDVEIPRDRKSTRLNSSHVATS